MNCGERKVDGTTQRFALIGVDLYQASPDDIEHVNDPVTGGYELVVVDVTDPTTPHVRSRVPATTSTHTVTCVVDTDCRYVYSAGDDGAVPGQGSFSIFDLTDLDRPVEVDSDSAVAGVQPFRSDAVGWGGHKWNFDGAGRGVHTGAGGSYVYDVSIPTRPVEIANTGAAGDSARERLVQRVQRLHPPQLLPPQCRRLQAGCDSVAGQRQHPARHRGGLRGPRLHDGGLVPDLAHQADGRLRRLDRAAGQAGAGRPGDVPVACRGVLLGALVRLPPVRDRVGRLLRRRHPVHRRHRPARARPATASRGSAPPRSGTATGFRSTTPEAWPRARRPISPTPSTW